MLALGIVAIPYSTVIEPEESLMPTITDTYVDIIGRSQIARNDPSKVEEGAFIVPIKKTQPDATSTQSKPFERAKRQPPDPPPSVIIEKAHELVLAYGGKQTDFLEMAATIQGESGFKHKDVYGDNGKAYGISQFHEDTFYLFARIMDFKDADYMNLEHQLRVMAWAFSQGTDYKKNWTEWRKLGLLPTF